MLVLLAAVVSGAWAQGSETKIYSVVFSDYTSYPFYNENELATVENGLLVLTNSKVYTEKYDVQPEIGRPTPITAGKCYRIAIEYKSTVGGPVNVVLGAQDWSTMMGAWWVPITVSDNFQTLEATYLKCNYGATDNHILFQFGDLVGTVYIKKVEVYEFDYVDVTSVTLSSSTATMTVDKKVALTATVAPDNATEKIVKWSVGGTNADAVKLYTDEACTTEVGSDATSALTVYAKGMSAGKATVKAESGADATKSATCTITVNPTFSATLKEGTEDADKWTIEPNTGLNGGETVTATYSGTKKVKSVKAVKKAATIPVTAITLNKAATTISAGNTETLSVTAVAPDNATDKTYTWKTSDASIATVDQDGKVTAVALGTVIIYAEANDGSGVKGNCTVTVSKVVTINLSDWGERGQRSFTKDGVTVSAGMIDPVFGELGGDITISTTLGIFTKIVVTAEQCYASGTGWSGDHSSMTWAGTPASTVSFRGEFEGRDSNPTTIVCTIVP